ncbi:uncharacterized protein LOC128868068 [Anastrepha ludens]|uniref:uncharacterized protein LOC128868068 n=1 Tax=Anastrepha ludens TaxID=28586 RepID=UPI0023AEDFA0|nr:uncharacterized protein LOC128868068 [Anastrepha ludens]
MPEKEIKFLFVRKMKISSIAFAIHVTILANLFAWSAAKQPPDSCRSLENTIWVHLCRGTVSQEIKIKYKDQLTSIGTPFKVLFLPLDRNSLMVSFFTSKIQNCPVIKIKANVSMVCNGINITPKQQMVYCFNFNLQYISDLIKLCYDQEDNLSMAPRNMKFGVLHYSHIPPLQSVQVRFDGRNKYILLLISAVLGRAM